MSTSPSTSSATSSPEPEKVTFQLLSDLHMQSSTHFYKFKVPPIGRYLLLAGDNGSVGHPYSTNGINHRQDFGKWLESQCFQFERVFLIAGNHEYKQNTVAQGNAILKCFEADPGMNSRLIVMEEDRYDLRDDKGNVIITILGCTLWSQIRRDQMNIYSLDWDNPSKRGIIGNNAVAHNARYARSIEWLRNEVLQVRSEDPSRKILVMTHHAPAIEGTSNPRYRGSSNWSMYGTDILEGEGVDGLQEGDVWVYGHTHWSTSWIKDEVQGYSNARGGSQEEAFSNYDVRFTFDM